MVIYATRAMYGSHMQLLLLIYLKNPSTDDGRVSELAKAHCPRSFRFFLWSLFSRLMTFSICVSWILFNGERETLLRGKLEPSETVGTLICFELEESWMPREGATFAETWSSGGTQALPRRDSSPLMGPPKWLTGDTYPLALKSSITLWMVTFVSSTSPLRRTFPCSFLFRIIGDSSVWIWTSILLSALPPRARGRWLLAGNKLTESKKRGSAGSFIMLSHVSCVPLPMWFTPCTKESSCLWRCPCTVITGSDSLATFVPSFWMHRRFWCRALCKSSCLLSASSFVPFLPLVRCFSGWIPCCSTDLCRSFFAARCSTNGFSCTPACWGRLFLSSGSCAKLQGVLILYLVPKAEDASSSRLALRSLDNNCSKDASLLVAATSPASAFASLLNILVSCASIDRSAVCSVDLVQTINCLTLWSAWVKARAAPTSAFCTVASSSFSKSHDSCSSFSCAAKIADSPHALWKSSLKTFLWNCRTLLCLLASASCSCAEARLYSLSATSLLYARAIWVGKCTKLVFTGWNLVAADIRRHCDE